MVETLVNPFLLSVVAKFSLHKLKQRQRVISQVELQPSITEVFYTSVEVLTELGIQSFIRVYIYFLTARGTKLL